MAKMDKMVKFLLLLTQLNHVSSVPLDLLDYLVNKDPKDHLALVDHMACTVLMVVEVKMACKDPKVQWACLAKKEKKELQDPMAKLLPAMDPEELVDQQVLLVLREFPDVQANPVAPNPDHLVLLEMKANLVDPAAKDLKDHPEALVHKDPKEVVIVLLLVHLLDIKLNSNLMIALWILLNYKMCNLSFVILK